MLSTDLPANDSLSYQIRSKLLLRGSTLLNTPRPIGRWSVRKFSPYWLKDALIEDYEGLRSRLEVPPATLAALDECISLDHEIRDLLGGASPSTEAVLRIGTPAGHPVLEHLLCALAGCALFFAIVAPPALPKVAIAVLYALAVGLGFLAYRLSLSR